MSENIEHKKTFTNNQMIRIIAAVAFAVTFGTGVLWEFRLMQQEMSQVKQDLQYERERNDKKHSRQQDYIDKLEKRILMLEQPNSDDNKKSPN